MTRSDYVGIAFVVVVAVATAVFFFSLLNQEDVTTGERLIEAERKLVESQKDLVRCMAQKNMCEKVHEYMKPRCAEAIAVAWEVAGEEEE